MPFIIILMPPSSEDNEDDFWEDLDIEVLEAFEHENGPIDFDEDEYLEHLDMAEELDEEGKAEVKHMIKWKKIRDAILPEPEDFEPLTYSCEVGLHEKFKKHGLQVIVKMATIELTPEKPDFPAGGWHVSHSSPQPLSIAMNTINALLINPQIEGQLNERIVATSLYYVDSENITSSQLAFRMQTDRDQDDLHHHLERIYGTNLGAGGGGSCLQNYGTVETREGRLLAFPNVL
jgi:Protein of unknown function (DUF4246)